jgi:hypothetical protein
MGRQACTGDTLLDKTREMADDRKQFIGPVAHKVFVRSPKAYWTCFPKVFAFVCELNGCRAFRKNYSILRNLTFWLELYL